MGTCSCSNATYAPPVAANNWNNQGGQSDPSKMGSQAGAAFNDVIKVSIRESPSSVDYLVMRPLRLDDHTKVKRWAMKSTNL